MKINEKDFKTYFHADVVSFAAATMEITNEVYFPDGSYLPILNSVTLQPQMRELILDFTSEEDMSNFASELVRPCIIDIDDGYEYEGILVSKSESEEGIHAFSGTYSFQIMKRKKMRIETNEIFIVEGNCECGCIYEVTAEAALEKATVDGISVFALTAGQTIIIDGINKLIYDKEFPDISKFDQTDVLRFPTLKPGSHIIEKSDETLVVVVKYYPIFM